MVFLGLQKLKMQPNLAHYSLKVNNQPRSVPCLVVVNQNFNNLFQPISTRHPKVQLAAVPSYPPQLS